MGNFILAIIGNKGGIGKTTLAYNLLYLLVSMEVSAVLIDCDNDQYSSSDCSEDRRDAGIEPELPIVNLPTEQLEKELPKLAKKYQVIIVEFGKANNDAKEKYRNLALELAIKVADKIVMPLQPTALDIKTVLKVESKLPLAAKDVPALIIPNRISPINGAKQSQLAMIRDLESRLKYFRVSKNYMCNRTCYQDSLGFSGRSIFEMDTKEFTDSQRKGARNGMKEFKPILKEIFENEK